MKHKNIMENWRRYLEQPEYSPYLIYERKGRINQINFDTLLTELDNGQTTEQEVYLIFEQALNYGTQQLIEEGLLDLLKKGYDKAGEIVQNVGEDIKAAWKKVNDFFIQMIFKAMSIASKGVEKFSKFAMAILRKVDKFRQNHPVIYNIVVAFVIIATVYAIFGSSTAEAAVKVGDKILTTGEVNAARGVFDEAARMKDISQVTDQINLLNASEILRKAHEAEEVINIKDLNGIVQSGVEVVRSTLEKADAGSTESTKDFLRWVKLGKNLQVQATGI